MLNKFLEILMLLSLAVMAADDIRHKSVMLWQVAVFGVICVANAVSMGIIFCVIPGGSLMGMIFGMAIMIFSEITGMVGIGDAAILTFLGVGMGGLTMLYIFFAALVLMSVCAAFAVIKTKAGRKFKMPFVPYILLASLGVVLCG